MKREASLTTTASPTRPRPSPHEPMFRRNKALHYACGLVAALAFASAGAFARGAGFQAISDDDFARVTIAQSFAHTPRWDPSGTSWLPFPFWLTGIVLRWFGRSLHVAELTALATASLAGWLLWKAGRLAKLSPVEALVAAVLPLSIPTVFVLSAATVPELLVGALLTFALIACAFGPPRSSLAAGLAVAAASLSRYDAWPVALTVVLALTTSASRATWTSRSSPGPVWPRWAGALLAAMGPLGWILWNFHIHEDPFWFARRVAAYHGRVAGSSSGLALLAGYPWAVVREGAALIAPAAVAFVMSSRPQRRPWTLPVVGASTLVVGLILAEVRGGAPTHHPERAVLTVWLLASLVLVSAVLPRFRASSRKMSFLAVMGFILGVYGVGRIRPLRAGLAPDRRDALAVGSALARLTRPGERILLAPRSYDYFATLAAFGRPEDATVVVSPSFDPRGHDVDPFTNRETLARTLASIQPRWVLVSAAQAPVAREFGLVLSPLPAGNWLASGSLQFLSRLVEPR